MPSSALVIQLISSGRASNRELRKSLLILWKRLCPRPLPLLWFSLSCQARLSQRAATREINLHARNVGNSLAKASSIDGPKPDLKDLPGAESENLLVSAFLLVNGWAKAPSVSEKTTYFKVGPRPIDLFYGEGSEDLNLAMTPGHQLMDQHLASGIINGGIGISLLAKPMAFGEDSLPSCIGWARVPGNKVFAELTPHYSYLERSDIRGRG
ncbi:hypothetical protein ACOSQ2_003133 [Xanthoceras sorbifolium]